MLSPLFSAKPARVLPRFPQLEAVVDYWDFPIGELSDFLRKQAINQPEEKNTLKVIEDITVPWLNLFPLSKYRRKKRLQVNQKIKEIHDLGSRTLKALQEFDRVKFPGGGVPKSASDRLSDQEILRDYLDKIIGEKHANLIDKYTHPTVGFQNHTLNTSFQNTIIKEKQASEARINSVLNTIIQPLPNVLREKLDAIHLRYKQQRKRYDEDVIGIMQRFYFRGVDNTKNHTNSPLRALGEIIAPWKKLSFSEKVLFRPLNTIEKLGRSTINALYVLDRVGHTEIPGEVRKNLLSRWQHIVNSYINELRDFKKNDFHLDEVKQLIRSLLPEQSEISLDMYIQAYYDSFDQDGSHSWLTGKYLNGLLPSVSKAFYNPLDPSNMVNTHRWTYDYTKAFNGRFPLEPELLLLCSSLRNPDFLNLPEQERRSYQSLLMRQIGYIENWMMRGIWNFPLGIERTWGRIGEIAHGFLPYKFETKRLLNTMDGNHSLVEAFGLAPLKHPKETLSKWGNGLLLSYNNQHFPRTMDPQTLIEFRRGYILITHPTEGTLVIKNASGTFGRGNLNGTAYYMKPALDKDGIELFTPQDHHHILKSILHPDNVTAYNKSIPYLLNQYDLFQANYQLWKVNTAPEKLIPNIDGSLNRFVGYLDKSQQQLRPGFKNMLQAAITLAELPENTQNLVQLAVVSRKTPVWLHEPFAVYPMTPQNIAYLRFLCRTIQPVKQNHPFAQAQKQFNEFLSQLYYYGQIGMLTIID